MTWREGFRLGDLLTLLKMPKLREATAVVDDGLQVITLPKSANSKAKLFNKLNAMIPLRVKNTDSSRETLMSPQQVTDEFWHSTRDYFTDKTPDALLEDMQTWLSNPAFHDIEITKQRFND